MANPEHLAKLNEGVDAWNEWHSENQPDLPTKALDLSGAILKGFVLRKINLSRVDLSGVDLSDAKLNGANLQGADLSDAVLVGVDLRGAVLQGAVLEGANLADAILQNSDFSRADLTDAILPSVGLDDVDFSGCTFLYHDFGGSDLSGANFSGADLTHANFAYSELVYASFADSVLMDADFDGANLSSADLSGAQLTNANFGGAILHDADLFGAAIGGVDLSEVVGLKQHQIEQALGDRTTTLPSGLSYPSDWIDGDQPELPLEIPSLPKQVPGPLVVRWQHDVLRPVRSLAKDRQHAVADGRASNYEHLKQETHELLECLEGNNAAHSTGLFSALDHYDTALGEGPGDFDVYRLGHAGIRLEGLSRTTEGILDDAIAARLSALVASHILFIRQEKRWRDYVTNAAVETVSPESDREAAVIANDVTRVIERNDVSNIIDPSIPKILRDQRNLIDGEGVSFQLQIRGYWTSFDNMLIGLVQRSIDFTRSNEFASWVVGESGELISRFGAQTIENFVAYGSHAVAFVILLTLLDPLYKLADEIQMLSWLKAVLDQLKKQLGDDRPKN